MGPDHYAWKSPFQVIQKYYQVRLRKQFPKEDFCSWKSIIQKLRTPQLGKEGHANVVEQIEKFCKLIDQVKGDASGLGPDLQQENCIKYQQTLNSLVNDLVLMQRPKIQYKLKKIIQELETDKTNLLFDERFTEKNCLKRLGLSEGKFKEFTSEVKKNMRKYLEWLCEKVINL